MDELDFSGTSSRSQSFRHVDARGVSPWFGYTIGTLVGIASILFIFQVLRFEYILNRAINAAGESVEKHDFKKR